MKYIIKNRHYDKKKKKIEWNTKNLTVTIKTP